MGECDRHHRPATQEGAFFQDRYRTRYRDNIVTTVVSIRERIRSDGSDRVGDDRALASCNEFVRTGFDDGIAVAPGIIYRIVRTYDDSLQAGASIERSVGDGDDRLWDGDGGQSTNQGECVPTNSGYRVGDDRILTTLNQFVVAGSDNGIAIVPGVIHQVARLNNDLFQHITATESTAAN